MKLLTPIKAKEQTRKENDRLAEENIRLRIIEKKIRERLNTIREDYTPEKVKRLKEFEDFCTDIMNKKSLLLKELAEITSAVEQKKELYYGLASKGDELIEKEHKLNEREKKLDLRLLFVEELESKWKDEELTI